MNVSYELLNQHLPFLGHDLLLEMTQYGELMEVPKGMQLLREGQYVKVIPIVLEGVLKVFTQIEDKELLLYYIQANESCVMSFSAILNNDTSKIYAITEEDSSVLLLPSEKVESWIKRFPKLNDLFYQQYNQRYTDLIGTIHELLYNRMDQRLLDYLREKSAVKKTNVLVLRHKEIATDLATAREVISRSIKKLELDKKIKLEDGKIILP